MHRVMCGNSCHLGVGVLFLEAQLDVPKGTLFRRHTESGNLTANIPHSIACITQRLLGIDCPRHEGASVSLQRSLWAKSMGDRTCADVDDVLERHDQAITLRNARGRTATLGAVLEIYDRMSLRVDRVAPTLESCRQSGDGLEAVLIAGSRGIRVRLSLSIHDAGRTRAFSSIRQKIEETRPELYRLFAVDLLPDLMKHEGPAQLLLPLNTGVLVEYRGEAGGVGSVPHLWGAIAVGTAADLALCFHSDASGRLGSPWPRWERLKPNAACPPMAMRRAGAAP